MNLEELGYNSTLEKHRSDNGLTHFDVGRVVSEHKDRYEVKSAEGDFECEVIGNLRYNAVSRNDLPAVGDWVAISPYDENKALIHGVYQRHSIIERQAVGKVSQKQIIATNIDFGLIVLSINRDFNVNRVERYLTICNASNISPIILLSKVDLIEEEEIKDLFQQIKDRIKNVPIIALSNHSKVGLKSIKELIQKGKTYCLLGSSGVGKSTLLNNLIGSDMMETGEISESIDRGKHVTSHRELVVLDQGGIIIDNPGMREVGITNSSEGLEITFDQIVELSDQCKFRDCSHTNESGCAILEALDSGDLDEDAYDNFQKMERERAHFETSLHEKKKKDKDMSKLIRKVVKNKKRNKF